MSAFTPLQKSWPEYWRLRLIRELDLRNFSPQTTKSYSGSLSSFLIHSPGNPKQRSVKHIESYLLYLRKERGLSSSTVNLHRNGLSFFYNHALKIPGIVTGIPRLKEGQKLPQVIDSTKIQSLLDGTSNLKHRLMLSLDYGCGFRLSELVHLRLDNIQHNRGILLIKKGKGSKDRIVTLPTSLIGMLEEYIRVY
jgi:integrase/recombinase XerD